MKSFLENYENHVKERELQGIPPLPLTKEQTQSIISLLKQDSVEQAQTLATLLSNRVNPGVDPAAEVKAQFLTEIALKNVNCSVLSPKKAVELLGTMIGGYNISGLISVLAAQDKELSNLAASSLKKLVLAVNNFDEVWNLSSKGNLFAKDVIESWAKAEWFTQSTVIIPESIKTVIYKVDGEINTDDFSPATFAYTRADIPLHATVMGGSLFPNGNSEIADLKSKHHLPITFAGDVVGTGSSRKSACNSLIWHIGDDIPFVPNKRRGGVILGSTIAPIFFNTAEDSGSLPLQTDVSKLKTGMVVDLRILQGKILNESGDVVSTFSINPITLLDEYKAGGRVNLIIGKELTEKARKSLNLSCVDESGIFAVPEMPKKKPNQGYTLAQKMVGRACDKEGILPFTACLPKMTTVGSQDTTGPMTASEMSELACLKVSADMVMQSFCHTAAYPKPSDIITHKTLGKFVSDRGGLALKVGDGVIHPWLNRLLLPDTVGTGGDSHTRFPLGISFPAGSGLVAFAATLGKMPLDMPESVLVRFKGTFRKGITLRDAVNAIPLKAIELGLLTLSKQNKKNIFAGRILEIEGLPNIKVEQAFELTDASAERSAAASTIALSRESVVEYLKSNVKLMEEMIKNGYEAKEAIKNRIAAVNEWIDNGQLLVADSNAQYAEIIEIDLNDIKEPIVACPNDPDNVKYLSEVMGDLVDEVFIGSCMTNVGQFRAAAEVLRDQGQVPTRLWICPPTKMDVDQLREEGYYSVFSAAGARMEMTGCSLCMGNQARVRDGATVFSTSTRNFNNRMGKDAQVYLGSSELAAVTAKLGKMPSPQEYFEMVAKLEGKTDKIYQYLNFHTMNSWKLL